MSTQVYSKFRTVFPYVFTLGAIYLNNWFQKKQLEHFYEHVNAINKDVAFIENFLVPMRRHMDQISVKASEEYRFHASVEARNRIRGLLGELEAKENQILERVKEGEE